MEIEFKKKIFLFKILSLLIRLTKKLHSFRKSSMKKIILLLLLIPFSITLFAQAPKDSTKIINPPAAPGKGKLSGSILDSTSKSPVEYATVALINTQSNKIVDGTMCDEKGNFSLSKIPEGSYKVTISFLGYNSYTSEPFIISDKKTTYELGAIPLGVTIETLSEVNVVGQKSIIEEKVDRTVYNAENDATIKGGDAADVLRKVPMLSVEQDGNVSLRGNQNIKILINNRQSTIPALTVANAIGQIPAEQYKPVE